MNTLTRGAAVATAAILTLAACGGTPSDEEAIDSLIESFNTGSDDLDLTDEQVRCISTEVVSGVGAERALEIDGSDLDGNLPLAEAEQVTDAFLGCIDTKAFFQTIINQDPEVAALPVAFVDCLVEQLDDDTLRTVFVGEFSGEDSANALGEAFGEEAGAACISVLTEEELAQLAGG